MAVEVDDCLREHREELRMKEAVSELVNKLAPRSSTADVGQLPRY